MNILICDDETERAEQWKLDINANVEGAEIVVPSKTSLQDSIRSLESRRKQLRAGGLNFQDDCLFDSADIVIIDYDLLELEEGAGFLTGDKVAYLSRVFSTAGFIIVVNQFGVNEYDLSFASDELSKADLNIGSAQMSNPGLWQMPISGGYRPWHWPILDKAAEKQRRRVSELMQGALDQSVLGFLGLDKSRMRLLSEGALNSISKGSKGQSTGAIELAEITFRDFVLNNSDVLEVKDSIAARKSEFEDQLCRIAAAAVHKWVERRVAIEQDLLIDIPHLLERVPQLFVGDEITKEALSSAVSLTDTSKLHERVSAHEFEKSDWVSRQMYWWPSLDSDAEIAEAVQSDEREYGDLVFREDVSNFGHAEESRDFLTSAFGVYNRRYVSDGNNIEGVEEGTALDVSEVIYSPSNRFAT